MDQNEQTPAWTWDELERVLLSLTPPHRRAMVSHLLETARGEASNLDRTSLLREILITAMLADGPWSFERSPSMERRLLN